MAQALVIACLLASLASTALAGTVYVQETDASTGYIHIATMDMATGALGSPPLAEITDAYSSCGIGLSALDESAGQWHFLSCARGHRNATLLSVDLATGKLAVSPLDPPVQEFVSFFYAASSGALMGQQLLSDGRSTSFFSLDPGSGRWHLLDPGANYTDLSTQGAYNPASNTVLIPQCNSADPKYEMREISLTTGRVVHAEKVSDPDGFDDPPGFVMGQYATGIVLAEAPADSDYPAGDFMVQAFLTGSWPSSASSGEEPPPRPPPKRNATSTAPGATTLSTVYSPVFKWDTPDQMSQADLMRVGVDPTSDAQTVLMVYSDPTGDPSVCYACQLSVDPSDVAAGVWGQWSCTPAIPTFDDWVYSSGSPPPDTPSIPADGGGPGTLGVGAIIAIGVAVLAVGAAAALVVFRRARGRWPWGSAAAAAEEDYQAMA